MIVISLCIWGENATSHYPGSRCTRSTAQYRPAPSAGKCQTDFAAHIPSGHTGDAHNKLVLSGHEQASKPASNLVSPA